MGSAIGLREDFGSAGLRALARTAKDAGRRAGLPAYSGCEFSEVAYRDDDERWQNVVSYRPYQCERMLAPGPFHRSSPLRRWDTFPKIIANLWATQVTHLSISYWRICFSPRPWAPFSSIKTAPRLLRQTVQRNGATSGFSFPSGSGQLAPFSE
jgi:hypothetical protein